MAGGIATYDGRMAAIIKILYIIYPKIYQKTNNICQEQ